MSKKPFKEKKLYIAAIICGILALVCLLLFAIFFDSNREFGSAMLCFLIVSAVSALLFWGFGFAKYNPQLSKSKRKYISNTEQTKSDDEKDFEEVMFYEMMEDD